MDQFVNDLPAETTLLIRLGLALILGLLVGIQRGWRDREQTAGQRVAGVRTHALVGLLGGVCAVLVPYTGKPLLPVAFATLAAIATLASGLRAYRVDDYSITGLIGLLLTFLVGALAVLGSPTVAAAVAVVTTIVLDNKKEAHDLLRKLEERELDAALKLLLISVVVLPLLPNQGYGPGGMVNPYEIWWMVVLIASISFLGYFAVKVGGTRRGLLFTSVFAGLSSSTALTLHFARLARRTPALSPLLAAGILLACGTMFPRILVYCLLLNRELLPALAAPILAMAALLYGSALVITLRHRDDISVGQPALKQNPLELKSALFFGLLLLAILSLGALLQDWLGDAGVYLLAATSGITDVDAITLSLTRLSRQGLSTSTAVTAIVLAAVVNNLVKTGMALFIGGGRLGRSILLPMGAALGTGLALAWLL
ncbi:MgtC/SapB family protein [Alloalcanivorax sp. C16-2]|uniref:MgtC/SapB family protein n=1 Tax=Alloalcanivorax sp. C16-2 TaxID=3390052 RepID=UPI003970FA3A